MYSFDKALKQLFAMRFHFPTMKPLGKKEEE